MVSIMLLLILYFDNDICIICRIRPIHYNQIRYYSYSIDSLITDFLRADFLIANDVV